MWRRASLHVSLRRALGEERPVLRSSSSRRPRSVKRQGTYAVTTAHHPAQLPILARTAGCASASTSQGSTGPHLKSACSHRVWATARAHHTAMVACPSACRVWRRLTNATCGVYWRLRRPGATQSWKRWRRSSGNVPSPQSLPRLRVPVAHEESFLQRTPKAAPTLLRLQNQVTSSKLV